MWTLSWGRRRRLPAKRRKLTVPAPVPQSDQIFRLLSGRPRPSCNSCSLSPLSHCPPTTTRPTSSRMTTHEISPAALPTLEQEPAAPSLSSSASDRDDHKPLDEKSVQLEGQPASEGELIDDAPLAGVVRVVFPSLCALPSSMLIRPSDACRPRSKRSTKFLAPAGASSASGSFTCRLALAATSSPSTRRQPRSTSSTRPRPSTSMRSSGASV